MNVLVNRSPATAGSFILMALLIAACSTPRPVAPSGGAPLQDQAAAPDNVERLHTLIAERQKVASATGEYRIGAGDLLLVKIYSFHPGGGDFDSEVRVDDGGYISLPVLPPMLVVGMTLPQFRDALRGQLQHSGVLTQPLLGVSLKEYQARRVIILGAVARPGQYNLSRDDQTLVDMLAIAGGLTDRAGNYVKLRPAPPGATAAGGDAVALNAAAAQAITAPLADGRSDTVVFRLDTAATENVSPLLLPLRAGDMIVVPDAGQAFVEGEIEKPGAYPLGRSMALTQLLATAGGMTFPADRQHVKLLRITGLGNTEQRDIDTGAIVDQQQPDVLLEPNDRIVVPATTGRMMAYGLYKTMVAIVHFGVGGTATVF